MNFLGDLYRGVLLFAGGTAGFAVLAMAVLVTIDIAGRNLGLGNLPWVVEVFEYVIYATTFLAAPWVLSVNGHVRVDFIANQLSASGSHRLALLVEGLCIVTTAAFLYYSLRATIDAFRIGSIVANELRVPEWWLLSAMPFCAALLLIEFTLRLLRSWAGEGS